MDYRGWLEHRHRGRGPAPASGERRHLLVVLVAASTGLFAVQLDFFALNLALPEMASELGVSTTDVQWVISGYMLALGAFLIPGGRLGDLLGRKRMLIVGMGIFGGASLIGGLAPNEDILVASRVVQGAGGAILFPLAIAVISNSFPPDQQMRAIGNAYGLGALATALGPLVGGGLTELISWRAVLLINVPITLFAIALVIRSVAESRDQTVPRSIDFAGVASVALGIGVVTFAVDRSADWGFLSLDTLGLLAVGLLSLAAFVARERTAPHPLVDLSLFRNRPYVGVTLIGMVANIGFVVSTFAVTLYLQRVEDYSAAAAGLIFVSASLASALTGPLSGRLGERFDIPRTMAIAIVIGAVGLVIVALGPGLIGYMLGLGLFGGGYGLGWSMASVGTQSVVPTERAGQASGVTLAIVIGAAGLAVAVVATIIESAAAGGTGLGPAIEHTLRVLAIATVVAAGVLLLATRPSPRARRRPPG